MADNNLENSILDIKKAVKDLSNVLKKIYPDKADKLDFGDNAYLQWIQMIEAIEDENQN